jgi:hypothetical protein
MRRTSVAVLLLLLSCGEDHRPPADLALLDKFADRVEMESMRAAWQGTKPKPFGVRPLLDLTEREIAALGEDLHDPQQKQCLQAIGDIAVHMQSESDPRVVAAMAQIASLRDETSMRRLIAARAPHFEALQRHRGYDVATVARLENEVRRALGTTTGAPALDPRIGNRFDAAHCLQRASFVFEWLGLPRNPTALQMRVETHNAFANFAFYPIAPPVEQGITVNPGAGIDAHWPAFHEYGHAALSLLAEPNPACRTFRRPICHAVSEGCAKAAERLFYSEEWLRTQGVPQDEIGALRDYERQSERMRMHSILDDIELERALYRDPRYAPRDPQWTQKRHLAFEPLARTDYLLARCAQAAIYRRLRKLPGGLLGDPARKVLRDDVFRGASGLRFEQWFRKATGEEPNCAAWLHDVADVQ